ncbi:MAG: hypothetical protein JF887_09010 [Candidatus Dormibacteraeota bacterium]|uniref:Uncharacterized protein n=1 Tax=Candidatus Amunia macphersoniae TaxID=3127014 RepID=A0A934NJJ6_9BACT|nr:hypothetical protein [Candidatus Dormibacteraeota bacterium]
MAAVVACVVSVLFASVVLRRYIRSGRPAFAAWAVGLIIFAAAAGCQAAGEHLGFTAPVFRAFYLLGGVLGVIWLSMGTLFLLAPRRVALAATAILAVVTMALAVDAAVVPVDSSRLGSAAGVLGAAIAGGSPLQVGAVFLNILGTLILVGGSAWSAVRLVRHRGGADRVLCNVLLTVGAFVIAAGFSAAKITGGSLDTLGVYEAVGITIMFAGFLSIGRF